MPILATFLAFFEVTKYPLIFLGSYIEGSVVMIGTGILWRTGGVNFWWAYGALLLGDFLADLMWYAIGYFGARKFVNKYGHYINMTPEIVTKVEHRFHKHHTWILIISKLTMGFGLAVATLTMAGMLRVPIWRFVVINLVGGIVWVFALMCIGYYFGNVLDLIPQDLKIVVALAVLVGVFFGLKYVSSRLARADW